MESGNFNREDKRRSDAQNLAGKKVMELAAKHEYPTQAAVLKQIQDSQNVEIDHQKLSQWCRGDTSFPNDFAQIFSQAIGLTHDEQIELALALSFGQRKRRLLKPADS